MKQVVNGKVSFFTSKAFEAFVVPKDRIEASWVSILVHVTTCI